MLAPTLSAPLPLAAPDAPPSLPAVAAPTRRAWPRLAGLASVAAVHLGLLWWVAASTAPTPLPTEAPALTGVLLSESDSAGHVNARAPSPPVVQAVVREASPQLAPLKAALPKLTPLPAALPVPEASPSERAVATPVPTPAPPAAPSPSAESKPAASALANAALANAALAAAAAAAPAPAADAGPVTPPSTSAAHLNNPEPVYPRVSRRLRQEGRVLLDVFVLPAGTVGELKVKRSSGFPLLDEAAVSAVRAWRFVPATRAGQAIAYWYTLPLDFSLDN